MRNPRTGAFIWSVLVNTVGHKSYCLEDERRYLASQRNKSQGSSELSFQFNTDPNLTAPDPLTGPELGYNLAKITSKTADSIMRQAANKLWTKEEQMRHKLSPKMKTKSGTVARTDFSPTRKSQMKGDFLLSFLFNCKSTRPTMTPRN